MSQRLFRIATWACTVLLALTVAFAVSSHWLNPWSHRLSFGNHFHVSVFWSHDLDIRLVFFNDANYGPYKGSMMSIVGAPPIDEKRAFGDTAGIYYRYFRDGPDTLWTLMLSIWYPAVLFSLLPGWYGLRRVWSASGSAPTS